MRTSLIGSLSVLALAFVAACDETIAATPLEPDAGVVPDAQVQPNCNASPRDDASVVVDACGVFVAPSGNDAAAGTKAAPLRTITKALELARAASKQVFVCGDEQTTYAEPATLVLDERDLHRGIFGGLACDGWSVNAAQRPTVRVPARPSPDPVVRASGARDVRLEDLAFVADDATDPGTSSIVMYLAQSAVVLRRLHVVAGRGAAGAAGTPSPAPVAAATKGTSGASGGGASSCTCPDGTTSGGAGGVQGVSGGDGADGTPASAPSSTAGAGGAFGSACSAGGAGKDGAAGTAGAFGLHAFRHGELTATSWVTRRGESGSPGARGQGGGGGAAGATGVGGGGGCGGCGGVPGTAGQGGGSSIGVASFESDLSIESTLIEVRTGGDGGGGAAGQAGQPGGAGGAPSAVACVGGAGGSGGAGGAGGGGSGGHSVAVLYKGIVPTLDAQTTSSAELRRSGQGGARGDDQDDRAPEGVTAALWLSD